MVVGDEFYLRCWPQMEVTEPVAEQVAAHGPNNEMDYRQRQSQEVVAEGSTMSLQRLQTGQSCCSNAVECGNMALYQITGAGTY